MTLDRLVVIVAYRIPGQDLNLSSPENLTPLIAEKEFRFAGFNHYSEVRELRMRTRPRWGADHRFLATRRNSLVFTRSTAVGGEVIDKRRLADGVTPSLGHAMMI